MAPPAGSAGVAVRLPGGAAGGGAAAANNRVPGREPRRQACEQRKATVFKLEFIVNDNDHVGLPRARLPWQLAESASLSGVFVHLASSFKCFYTFVISFVESGERKCFPLLNTTSSQFCMSCIPRNASSVSAG